MNVEFELDGKKVSAPAGSNILEVALKEGKYIPHFCYHKKMSIAANCRMCLVEVEKAPKPLPACATPITEGMKVQTCSKLAVEAQKGVMEFLLINHPLDCPVCDQGGECQLQDLAVGYGRSSTRFEEEKRAVTNKDLGSLVSTEMTRCIHCSRCVRFTDEIAGFQELGMSYRNNHVEVMPFIGKTVDSEISGNIIDVCPVGALLSKPFKNKYRNWELSRRKSIAPHDGLGSNIVVQTDKYHKVARVLPLENEELNECWLSDRDRFSYEGLYHEERNTTPMIKQDGKWINTSWETAIQYAAKSINGVRQDHGSEAIGVLASNISTVEELYLLQKLMRCIDVNNIDSRLFQSDFSLDHKISGTLSLGGKVTDLASSKSILLIGSVIREEQPLIASKIRTAVKKGTELNVINVLKDELLCDVKNQLMVDPREMVYTLAQVAKAAGVNLSDLDLSAVEVSAEATSIAQGLAKGGGYIVLGNVAKSLPDYSKIVLLAQELARVVQAKFGQFAGLANEVGADLVGFVPYKKEFNHKIEKHGLNAMQMLKNPRRAYVLLNTELECDAYNPAQALTALKQADTVVVMSPFINEEMKNYADVILPITPFTETAGSYVNMEGRWQTFNGVTRPLGDSKPGWKVLRVLANNLNLAGFDYNNIEEVRAELKPLAEDKPVEIHLAADKYTVNKPKLDHLVRFGIQGIYYGDSIVRRASSLQQTAYAKLPDLVLSPTLAAKLNVKANDKLKLEQGEAVKELMLPTYEKQLPERMVLLSANIALAGRFDEIKIKV
ncbi:MAG: NADH-quinone oxidoreductase subunit [Burkholderiales bacterium]|jgi:NADH-quinone oxidoreductase subunit G|nr:NADH-quinone oxidoreductase subunit [Burkholderiales bacterium]